MTDDERLAIPDVEVTAMLERRADRAGLSDPDRERLVRSIMARVDGAAPVAGPMRARFGWRSLAASMAGLVLALAAAGGLIVGMPAAAPGSPSAAAFPTPFELRPTGLRIIDQAELNALLDRHVVGDVIARIDPTPLSHDQSVALCAGADPCLPLIGAFSRGMPDTSISAVITAEPSLAEALVGQPIDGVAALHLDGSDTVQLLGYLDQGEAMVEPFVASAMALADAATTRPMDRTAMVVSGWLSGLGPRHVDDRIRLVADAADHDRATPENAVLLPDDAYRAWTRWVSRDGGKPDNGLFVLRPNPEAGGEWRIVGRLDDDPEPDPDLTIRLSGWTVVCGSVPSGDCAMVARAFARFASAVSRSVPATVGTVTEVVSLTARAACPPDAPQGTVCWQLSVGVDGDSDCTVIGLPGPSAGAGYGWTANRAPGGIAAGADGPATDCE
jgi:hypothetical protein